MKENVLTHLALLRELGHFGNFGHIEIRYGITFTCFPFP